MNTQLESKVCTKCKRKKLLPEFPFRNKERNTYRSVCKVCHNAYSIALRRGEIFRPAVPTIEHGVVKSPAMNVWERPVYVPPKWNGPVR